MVNQRGMNTLGQDSVPHAIADTACKGKRKVGSKAARKLKKQSVTSSV